jgi:hypothetical protein
VKAVFNDKLLGIVEVFQLEGHPKANAAYAWLHDTGNSEKPMHVTVLRVPSVVSPLSAVRDFLVQESKNKAPA